MELNEQMNREFLQNQKIGGDIQFLPDDNHLVNRGNNIKFQHIQSGIETEKSLEEEVQLRFYHEKNKVQFIKYTVQKLQYLYSVSASNEFFIFLVNMQILLTQKARLLNHKVTLELKNRRASFNVKQNYFELFRRGEFFKPTLDTFEKDQREFDQVLHKLRFKTKKNRIPIKYPMWLEVKLDNNLGVV